MKPSSALVPVIIVAMVWAIALALLSPGAGFAAEPAPAAAPTEGAVAAVDNLLITTPPPPPNVRTPVLSWGEGN
ncbi:MAG: hypothetical protein H6Q82_1138, partial [Deltaproteobacteria bacterium]|nr:hypothetical protein [Deltaproteobacteria bacterium]